MEYTYEDSWNKRLHSNSNNSIAGHSTSTLKFTFVASLVLVMTATATLCFSFWCRWRSKRRNTSSSLSPGGGVAIAANASPASLPQLAVGDALASTNKLASRDEKPNKIATFFPVVMPGDAKPTFVAQICHHIAAHISEDECDDSNVAGHWKTDLQSSDQSIQLELLGSL